MAPARDPSNLEGTLERVLFQNADSQWTVARLMPDGGNVEVTVVGSLLGVPPGTPLRLTGEWVDDPKFGRQFKFDSYHTKSPETIAGIERYLGSGLIDGIGDELAKRIVAKFGLDTFEVITKDPSRLREVEGIGPTRIEHITSAWTEQASIRDVIVFLRGHGVSTTYAVRIYKKYGNDAIGLIRANPYRLALDIWGIGFRSADSIARSLGIAASAPERLEAGLVHTLGELTDDGHVHVPRDHLITSATDLLEVDSAQLEEALDRLVGSELVVAEALGDKGECISLTAMWDNEVQAAEAFAALATTPASALRIDVDERLAAFESEVGIELASAQRRAIKAALLDKVAVITGGPGVGKTTIIRAVVELLASDERSLSLAAPTGRAAKRLSESTGRDASTLHRLLEFNPQVGGFQRNAGNPLEVDAVIVDEVSMVDIALFHALLVALPTTTRLVLVGDRDQLPSVGPGSVLADVIASGAASVVELTEIFRQAAASHIIVNAHSINRGELPALEAPPGRDAARSDFYFIGRDAPLRAQDMVVDLVANRIPDRFGFDPLTEIQVLTPMHRGDLGTEALNAALQRELNPAMDGQRQLKRGDRSFRVGDKVMQIRNDYEKSVFNGDIGVIDSLRDGSKLFVRFLDGRFAEYERAELDQLVHAFAITIHKSQGSEYPAVVIPLLAQHYMMLQRNLLYTAITRGKRLVVLVGSKRAVGMAVKNDSTRMRWTWLAERIRAATEA